MISRFCSVVNSSDARLVGGMTTVIAVCPSYPVLHRVTWGVHKFNGTRGARELFGFQAHFGRLVHVFSQVATPVHEERSPLIESSGNNSWLNVPAEERA